MGYAAYVRSAWPGSSVSRLALAEGCPSGDWHGRAARCRYPGRSHCFPGEPSLSSYRLLLRDRDPTSAVASAGQVLTSTVN